MLFVNTIFTSIVIKWTSFLFSESLLYKKEILQFIKYCLQSIESAGKPYALMSHVPLCKWFRRLAAVFKKHASSSNCALMCLLSTTFKSFVKHPFSFLIVGRMPYFSECCNSCQLKLLKNVSSGFARSQ